MAFMMVNVTVAVDQREIISYGYTKRPDSVWKDEMQTCYNVKNIISTILKFVQADVLEDALWGSVLWPWGAL